jgi:PIN like domain
LLQEEAPPEFFIDRSLGSERVAARLREAGLVAHVMNDVYPGLEDLDDDVWIPEQAKLDRVLLTKDKNIRRNKEEHRAVRVSRARMFCLTNGNLTSIEQAERFYEHRDEIVQWSRKEGPYIVSVKPDGLEKVFPLAAT